MKHARSIILTSEDSTTDARWEYETCWTLKMCETFTDITSNSIVLDWGCGVGRLSKALIDKFGCQVVGVDLEPKMLDFAKDYVNNNRFSAITRTEAYSQLPSKFFTHTLSVWVFQHSIDLEKEIPLVYRSMQPGAWLLVVENITKAIPDAVAFFDDGVQTSNVLDNTGFETQATGKIPLAYTSLKIHTNSWWKTYTKPNKRGQIEYNLHY